MPRVLLSANAAWNIFNFRSSLIAALVEAGYDVVCAAPEDEYVSRLEKLGCSFCNISIESHGTSPIADLRLLLSYCAIIRCVQPDVFLGYTIKPNIWGTLAARWYSVPVVNNVSGLGASFINISTITRVVRLLYRIALRNSSKIFFQNSDDRVLFQRYRIGLNVSSDVLPGSGVDLMRFAQQPMPEERGDTVFLLIARLLREKGVVEFVDAARVVRRR